MGRPKNPDGAHSNISVRVPDGLHEDVQLIAEMEDLTVSDYLRELVYRDIETRKAHPDWHAKRDAVKRRQIAELKARIEALGGN